MEAWGADGSMDPFNDIYNLVFQMTVRMASCQELAFDPAMVERLSDLFWKLEKGSTPVGLLFPWFPSAAKKHKYQATKGLFAMMSHFVDKRRKAEVPSQDAIDVLIADGLDNPSIVQASFTFTPRFVFVCVLMHYQFTITDCIGYDIRWIC
jgi:hypothetical protein